MAKVNGIEEKKSNKVVSMNESDEKKSYDQWKSIEI